MELFWVLALAFVLDICFGDPPRIPHPVVGIGTCITWLEQGLSRFLVKRKLHPLNDKAVFRTAGILLALLIVCGTWGITQFVVGIAGALGDWVRIGTEGVIVWLAIAPRGLAEAGMAVFRALVSGDLPKARRELSMVVGRDTEHLDEGEIVRGGVETVAENIVDAVVSPLFWAALGGAPMAMAYRAVNTLDAMVGYRDERYLHLGWASARLDDAANWLPARVTVLPMLLSMALLGHSPVRAWRTYRRDARLHSSPNSGIPESLMAGGLGIQLGGINQYRGVISRGATLGDLVYDRRPEHLLQAVRVMWLTSVLALFLCMGLAVLAG